MLKPKKAPYGTTKKEPESTMADINKMLRSFGINSYQWTTLWDRNQVELRFAVETEPGKNLMISVTPPTFTAKRRTWNSKRGKYEVVEAPNWPQCLRLLFWWLKARLEAVAFGLREVEEEFLSDVVVQLPSGEATTIGKAIKAGKFDLPALGSGMPPEEPS